MKKLFIASGLLALMAAATSCDKYDIYDDQYGDVLLIKDGGDISMDVYSTDDYADHYISVIKGGHSPERTSHATLRVMTDEDFAEYKEINYGDPNFGGLQMIDPKLFDLLDSEGNVSKSISHTFNGDKDRYFGATLRIKSDEFCTWYRDAAIQSELASKQFIIPIGLYSETDSVNEYNNVLMVSLNDLDPKITCEIADGGFKIDELSRRKLINDIENLGEGESLAPYLPEVYLSIPCKNPWGFYVRIAEPKTNMVPDFADEKKSIPLQALKNDDKEGITRWALTDTHDFPNKKDATDLKNFAAVHFPVGVTKARIPLEIYLDALDPDNMLDKNLVVPIKIENPRTGYAAIAWEADFPEENPENDKIKPDENIALSLIDPSQFYIGIKVIEAPIDLDDNCVVSNDCEPTEGSIAGLFDDDLSTFFHSGWTVAFERSEPYGSYLEISLPEEINSVYFNITARSTNPCSPKKIKLYYAKEIDNEHPENTEWIYFETATNSKKLASGQSFEIGKINKMFKADETFRFLRFCVVENDKGQSLTTTSTANYWNLAELKLYGKVQE